MAHSKAFRSTLAQFGLGALAAVVLAFAPSAALAQHGGGGHSGGGGGGHVGGGSGGGHSSSGSHGSGSSKSSSHSSSSAPAHLAPVTGSAHPVAPSGNAAPPMNAGTASRFMDGGAVPQQTLVAAPGGAFVLRSASPAPRNTVLGFSASTPSPWQAAPMHSGAVRFSGQGRQIWQEPPSPAMQNVAPAASGRAIVAHPFMPRLSPRRIISSPQPVQVFFVPPFGFFGPGFGFFGNGFGCDPFWGWGFDQGFGCNGFGYGYGLGYGGPGYGYGYNSGAGYDTGNDNSSSVSASQNDSANDTSDDSATSTWQNPPADNSDSRQPSAASAPVATLIYLHDGSIYQVMSYWLDAGKLHYITNYGGENVIDMSDLDLQRTVDENAQRGAVFTLRPASSAAPVSSAPDAAPPADSAPASSGAAPDATPAAPQAPEPPTAPQK